LGESRQMVNKSNCLGCEKPFVKTSKSGYCGACFHQNVNNVKSDYNKKRWLSGIAKIQCWEYRGANLAPPEIEEYENATSCQICQAPFRGDKCMDHDHRTGRYRGTLCRQCNSAIGKLGDDLDLVISRLEAYRAKVTASSGSLSAEVTHEQVQVEGSQDAP
jgi:Zn finger protein HypA/HybF involved in hydrogenase expression